MVGGCLGCCSVYVSVLLLGVCLHDVEASSCDRHVHKKVGDTVELSSCLPSEGVTDASWNYRGLLIADKDRGVHEKHQFIGRLELNPTNFSLTVRGLTLLDSGDFLFVSAVNDKQRKSVTVSLHVHESITKGPVVTSNSTWDASNESCTVSLECIAATESNISYSWTVSNRTFRGSRLQYVTQPQDGDTEFTCTISNRVSEKSAVKTWKCSNITSPPPPTGAYPNPMVVLSAAGGGCLLIVIVVGVAVCVCLCKKKHPADFDMTLYADVSDVVNRSGSSTTMKSCTLYETINNSSDAVTAGPQTVYDEIKLSRIRKASVSPNQDVS